jgi:hypothetical protein
MIIEQIILPAYIALMHLDSFLDTVGFFKLIFLIVPTHNNNKTSLKIDEENTNTI